MELTWIIWSTTVLLGAGFLIVAAAWQSFWRHRRLLGKITIVLFLASIVTVAASGLPLGMVILMLTVQACFVLLSARLLFGRLDEQFLRPSTTVNATIGLGLLVFMGLANWLSHSLPAAVVLGFFTVLSGLVAVVFLRQIFWTFQRFRLPKSHLDLKQLPTVSVCIPARNEDHELTECIAAVLRSDYPKLEVIVLDDCSQDKTADVIKSFAHSGVRFVQGDEPAIGWLGKNQAMKTMAQHASGQWLLFLSADTQLGLSSINHLVHFALAQNKQMISVLPQNLGAAGTDTLLGTLQYYWQIAFPLTKRRVPVSGKSWLINAQSLKKLGGFDSVKHKIIPEGSFARRLFAQNQYRFFVSDAYVAMTSNKSRKEQMRTSIRLLYPTFKRQPMFILFGLLGLSLLQVPFFTVFLGMFWGNVFLLIIGSISSGLLFLGYLLVMQRTHPASWMFGSLCLPIVLLQEMFLCVKSLLDYEFSQVSWKGRNVCYPVISGGQRSTPLRAESTN